VAPTKTHTKLLTAAARETLRPMGLVQRGRSRTWIDDGGWWLCVVEFQPSSWSKGSYLNVGAMWLWRRETEDIYFAVGHRVSDPDFVRFESEAQFAPEAQKLAALAAERVAHYRELFVDVRSAAAFLDRRGDGHNPHLDALDAGIAWGFVGEVERAARSFERSHAIIERYWSDWASAVESRTDEERTLARAEGVFLPDPSEGPSYRAELDADHALVARYESLLADPTSFRAEIEEAINLVREKLRLPVRPNEA